MTITPRMYIIVLPLVFLAALVDAIGGGGGLISMPAYTLAGLDYGYAAGCNKFASSFGTLSAVFRFAKSGKIRWAPALYATVGALPGSWLGTKLSLILGTEIMQIFMICAIPCVAAVMLLKKDREDTESNELTRGRLIACIPVGFLIGCYDGFFGPGTGTFLILLFRAVAKLDLVSASATTKPVNLLSNLTSLITRICAGQVLFALALPCMVCSITGGQIGAKLALTKGARFIRWIMLGVLVLLMLRLIPEIFF